MRTFALVLNTNCGAARRIARRTSELQRAFAARQANLLAFPTSAPGQAAAAIGQAVSAGCEGVLAGGGDGTVNHLLQALVERRIDLPLGVIPLGSGNILAQELGVSPRPARLVDDILEMRPAPVAVGAMTSADRNGAAVTRHFMVAAGIGADARVICAIDPRWKARLGIGAYYAESTRQLLFSRRELPFFLAEFTDSHTGRWRAEGVTQLIAERVGYFGRCVAGRNGHHGLARDEFRLVLFKTNRHAAYLAYGARMLWHRLAAVQGDVAGVEVAHTRAVRCLPFDGEAAPEPVMTEVDGELVGTLPAEITLGERHIQLFMPGPR